MCGQQKEEVLWCNVRKRCLRGRGEVGGGGACKNPVRLSMYDDPMETVEYMWVNI